MADPQYLILDCTVFYVWCFNYPEMSAKRNTNLFFIKCVLLPFLVCTEMGFKKKKINFFLSSIIVGDKILFMQFESKSIDYNNKA